MPPGAFAGGLRGGDAGQSVPLPGSMYQVGALPIAHALAVGRRVWSQQGLWDDAAPTVAAFRVCIPPCPGCRFARSLGPLSQVLALVAYATASSRAAWWGRSRERTPRAGRANAACRGSRWALESRLMLSPLPSVVTAQKPSDVDACRGFCILGNHQLRAQILAH